MQPLTRETKKADVEIRDLSRFDSYSERILSISVSSRSAGSHRRRMVVGMTRTLTIRFGKTVPKSLGSALNE